MAEITCLHTAQGHVARFDALFAAQNWDGGLCHVVRPDLLARAQVSGIDAVRADVAASLAGVKGAVLCTCSTLGAVAEALSALRIDRPMMQAACDIGGRVLVAICLPSTRAPTLALLAACGGDAIPPKVVLCDDAWPAFEAGDMSGFAERIARKIRDQATDVSCVVLAQASMQVAEAGLADLGVPVLSSPALAVARVIEMARG